MRQAVKDQVQMGEQTMVITVDVIRADGTLVTVTGGNTASFRAGHPRPGTNLDEVTAIALDEAWAVDAEPKAKDLAAAKKLDPFVWMRAPTTSSPRAPAGAAGYCLDERRRSSDR